MAPGMKGMFVVSRLARRMVTRNVVAAICGVCAITSAQAQDAPSYAVFPVQVVEQATHTVQPDRRITLTLKDVAVPTAIHKVIEQAGMALLWNKVKVPLHGTVTTTLSNVTVQDALAKILQGTGAIARLSPDRQTFMILSANRATESEHQTTGTVTGTIVDSATGKGIKDATVSIQGTNVHVVTTEKGTFVLRDVPAGKQLLTVKLFGYKPTARTVEVPEHGRTTVHIILVPTATVLSGVVTTATGQEQRLHVGNDISVINVDSVMQVAPVTNVTQLLQDRVPGLVVQTTSGIPGAPSRLRLRGVSSISGNNDPIVIVDGVRFYSDQSGSGTDGNISNVPGAISNAGGGSRVATGGGSLQDGAAYAGPSALDQIDPNSIETIEVMKGPSASALYGSDAANGVIVITTKRGRVGPARWNAAADLGRSALQGTWPVNYFRFGSPQNGGTSTICSPYQGPQCTLDSVVAYQALNDPAFSPLGTGGRQDMSLGVSGGNGTLTYAFTGSASHQTGYLHVPNAIADNFATTHGFAAPDWMVHPLQYSTWGGTGRLDVQLGHSGAALSFSENLFHSKQQQSSLQSSFATLQSAYLTPENLTTAAAAFINQYYERAQLQTMTTTNTITLNNWAPWSWLPINATLGMNTANQENSSLLPRNYVIGSTDSLGSYNVSRGANQDQTLNVGTSLRQRFAQVAIGINVHTSSTSALMASTGQGGIPLGVTTPTTIANTGGTANQFVYHAATYGWYVQPTFHVGSRLFINPGMRFDGGSASGAGNTMNLFPKTDISYLAVNRPTDPLFGVLTLVRPRIAFGISGVQPGPAEALRTFITTETVTPFDTTGVMGTSQSIISLSGLGNTKLHPERSRELEGGIDLGFGNDRFTLNLTGYNKTRYDAIIAIPVAPSVVGTWDGGTGVNVAKNIGTIRNTGFEASVGARVLDTRSVGWSINANWATDRNRVVHLLPGQLPIVQKKSLLGSEGFSLYQTRVTPGYPLFGMWANPIVSYTDANEDGLIDPGEVRLADSAVYVGAPYPAYTLNASTTVTVLNGRLSVNMAGDYTSGLTQLNGGANLLQLVVNDPTSSLSTQAAVAAEETPHNGTLSGSAFGRIQTVNMLRWTTLSVSYVMSPTIARFFRMSSMNVALQGSNLGLHTNYRGKDPDVNAFAMGNSVADLGQLPQPRTWSLRVTLGD